MTTTTEVSEMLASGMEQITPTELQERLKACGYRLEPTYAHNYTNRLNHGKEWEARAVTIVQSSGQSAFGDHSKTLPGFAEMQSICWECFCYENGRIWEL